MPPDDVDTLALKALIAQAEGDLPRAAALLAPLHPNADNAGLGIQVYQAILERLPAQIIPRLKEILPKPDPAWGYGIGELHFYVGWAQEVAGDHAAAQESWRQARSELESFLKEQPEQAMATSPIEKDALLGAASIARSFPGWRRKWGEPDRAIASLEKLLSIPGHDVLILLPLTAALLRLDPMFDPLRDNPRFQKLVALPGPK